MTEAGAKSWARWAHPPRGARQRRPEGAWRLNWERWGWGPSVQRRLEGA